MGGGLSVCNKTKLSLHVGFGHVGPLYYENFLQPKHCMVRNDIGNTWMTLFIRTGAIDNTFDFNSCAMPIIGVAGAVLIGAGTIVSGIGIAGAAIGAIAGEGVAAGFAVAGGAAATTSAVATALPIAVGNCLVISSTVAQFGNVLAGGVTGVAVATQVQSTIFSNRPGYYTNCMRWDVIGGTKINRNTDGTTYTTNNDINIVNGHHYGCHSRRKSFIFNSSPTPMTWVSSI